MNIFNIDRNKRKQWDKNMVKNEKKDDKEDGGERNEKNRNYQILAMFYVNDFGQ